MSRFKDLCPSSDSDSEEETQAQSFQRGRVRENKKFVQIDNSKLGKQTQLKSNKQAVKQKANQTKLSSNNRRQKLINLQKSTDIYIETNSYPITSISLDANQKFIRQNIKPVQQQMQHYLQKMYITLEERKKFTNALTAAARDLQKVQKHIAQIENMQQVSKLETMKKLQQKINRHLSNLMAEHHKTVEMLILCRKQIDNYFNKVKFLFLDIDGMSLYEPQTQSYKEYGIKQLYKILEKADSLIHEHTSFSNKQK